MLLKLQFLQKRTELQKGTCKVEGKELEKKENASHKVSVVKQQQYQFMIQW